MKYALLFVLSFLTGCNIIPPASERVDIFVENPGTRLIRIRATIGFLGKTLELAPGERRSFWFPRRFVGGRIFIRIEAKKLDEETSPR